MNKNFSGQYPESEQGDAVIIRRMGCRDEKTHNIFMAALIIMEDDVALACFPKSSQVQFNDDMGIIRMIAEARNKGDNATLEEVMYFIEWKRLPLCIDDVFYPHDKIRAAIFDYNRETIAPGEVIQELPPITDDTPPPPRFPDGNFELTPPPRKPRPMPQPRQSREPREPRPQREQREPRRPLNVCNRSHEECAYCALEKVEPPQCPGHAAGPVSCPLFVAIPDGDGHEPG